MPCLLIFCALRVEILMLRKFAATAKAELGHYDLNKFLKHINKSTIALMKFELCYHVSYCFLLRPGGESAKGPAFGRLLLLVYISNDILQYLIE